MGNLMEEHKLIRTQLLKNTLYNLLAFTIIFTIFGAIIFKQIEASLYNNVDKELENAREGIPQNAAISPRSNLYYKRYGRDDYK